MKQFIITTQKQLLVVNQQYVLVFNKHSFSFIFREKLPAAVLDYATDSEQNSVLLLLESGDVFIYDSDRFDLYPADHLTLFDPRQHTLPFCVRFDKDAGFIISSPFAKEEWIFNNLSNSRRYVYRGVREKTEFDAPGSFDKSIIQIYGPDGELISHKSRRFFSKLENLFPEQLIHEKTASYDFSNLNDVDLCQYVRFACGTREDDSILLTLFDAVVIVYLFKDGPMIAAHMPCEDPSYAMWSRFSKDYFIVKHKSRTVSLYKNYEPIIRQTRMWDYQFIDESTFIFIDDEGVHIIDLEEELETYLLPINKTEGSIGWRAYREEQ